MLSLLLWLTALLCLAVIIGPIFATMTYIFYAPFRMYERLNETPPKIEDCAIDIAVMMIVASVVILVVTMVRGY